MSTFRRMLVAILLATGGVLALPSTGRAAWMVTLNTSGLESYPNTIFAIDLQFSQGAPNTSNTATINTVSFGNGGSAGSVLGSPYSSGIESGNLNSQVNLGLSPTTYFSEFVQTFTPGSQLQFNLYLGNPPGNSDAFTFNLLYSNASTGEGNFDILQTTDTNNSSLLTINNIPNSSPQILTYAGDDSNFSDFTATPIVTPLPSPEPGTFGLIALALPVLAVAQRRFRTGTSPSPASAFASESSTP